VDSKTIEAMTPGAIRVDSPAESEDLITPLLPWIGPRSLTRTTRCSKTSRIYPVPSTRPPSTRRLSADNSRNWVFTARATRARVKLITTKMEMTTLTLAFNSLRAK
jgi:hypothetical protein